MARWNQESLNTSALHHENVIGGTFLHHHQPNLFDVATKSPALVPLLASVASCQSQSGLEMNSQSFGRTKGFFASVLVCLIVVLHPPPLARGYPMRCAFYRMSARSISSAPLFSTVNNSGTILSNQVLVSNRLQLAQAKKRARQQSQQILHERNLQTKRLLHNSTFQVPPLYAVKVSVCEELRHELRLNGREKRGRLFVEIDSPASQTLQGLKQQVHSFFRCLRKSTYTLHGSLPEGKYE